MSAHVNRTLSMISGDGAHTRNVASAVTDPLLARRARAPAPPDTSPLQVFVKAKRKINAVYVEIEEYVTEALAYMQSLDDSVAAKGDVDRVGSYMTKVHSIRDVLARDHMKVAFFGRTSNGKSTVINAMLHDKVLPSGIGHTTNCFLQVEGSNTPEAYLVTEQSDERRNIRSVAQLAHALCKERLGESELVRVYWPRHRCPLLRDDVVFVDSPGVDVSPNLDEWIDKHCLDADVFVLVANAESTLMLTEKNFFHKVSTRLSKPNIFVLNNRWDASASEPEFLDQHCDEQLQVRRQHQERAIDFLARELKVCTAKEAEERIFFVSAKEALQARMCTAQAVAEAGAGDRPKTLPALADGFQGRYFEFESFERRFEECISKSAVRTKFEQHAQRGRAIAADIRDALDAAFLAAHGLRERLADSRERLHARLERMERELVLATSDTKDMIRRLVDDVEGRVSRALSDEIRRLATLVDEFDVPFHPEPLVLNVYKRELHVHVEQGLGSNLRARLSSALAANMEHSQREMVERMQRVLAGPEDAADDDDVVAADVDDTTVVATTSITHADLLHKTILPARQRPFEILYRLNCDNLCADFHENLEFRFSWGITALIQRFAGARHANRLALKNAREDVGAVMSPVEAPRDAPDLSSYGVIETVGITAEDWSVMSRVVMASVGGSQGTVGGLFVAGFLLKTVGWRLVVVSGALYACLYLYERLTWTNKAKERLFKKQYVRHATNKLRLIVDLTSANCSHQVQQELSSTFARLCQVVDGETERMHAAVRHLELQIRELEQAASAAKVLKNKANYLMHELDMFEEAYIKSAGAP